MKTLTLSLKKQWFYKIKSGEKKEEYREIKPKYLSLFCNTIKSGEPNKYNEFNVSFKLRWNLEFDKLVFTLGYPKAGDTERRLVFKNPKIRIGQGRPEWGAERGKNYFVITWEE